MDAQIRTGTLEICLLFIMKAKGLSDVMEEIIFGVIIRLNLGGDFVDVLNKEQRHKAMSHIKNKDTSIEVALRKALWKKGYRYRKNYKALPGTPDIVLTKQKIVIFCDGELFHGKNWEILRPKLLKGNNPDYWVKKIERNMERDRENDKKLLYLGWTVIHFWGNDILKNPDECIEVIEETIFDNMITNSLDEEI